MDEHLLEACHKKQEQRAKLQRNQAFTKEARPRKRRKGNAKRGGKFQGQLPAWRHRIATRDLPERLDKKLLEYQQKMTGQKCRPSAFTAEHRKEIRRFWKERWRANRKAMNKVLPQLTLPKWGTTKTERNVAALSLQPWTVWRVLQILD